MSELTFKNRVNNFWDWYQNNAERYYQAFDDGTGPDLIEEIAAGVKQWLPGFAFVFGPGKDGVGHSFTLSAEGNINQQFLTAFWLSQAPAIEGWTFYDSRQPSDGVEDFSIDIGDFEVSAADIVVETTVDEENEKIDIRVWHPNFEQMDDNLRYTVFFIFLDEVLGETGSQSWVGDIDLSKPLSDEAKPIAHLREFIVHVQAYYKWEKLPPCDTYTGYQMPEPNDDFPRADTVAGATSNFRLLGEYFENQGVVEDPLEGSGAQFVYLKLDREVLPEGNQVEFRFEIEESIDLELKEKELGRVFGGATGLSGAYIDIFVADGTATLDAIHEVLKKANLENHYSVESFFQAQ